MIDRKKIAQEQNWTLKEVYKAVDCWRKAKKRQPFSTITFLQYVDLVKNSGLRPDNIGLKKGQYHLARYNDTGSYDLNNCRFIPQEQNQKERKEGYQKKPDFRQKASVIALNRTKVVCNYCQKSMTQQMFSRWHGDKCKKLS